MTILAVLRHAKSSWDDAELDDRDRPLNDRGRNAARKMGRELRRRRTRFDRVIASPALRVRQTLAELAKGFGAELDVGIDERIYENRLDTLFQLVRSIPEEVHAPLIVGHNPALQQLVLALTRDDDAGLRRKVSAKFPTAAFALLDLPADRWDEVAENSGQIVELILPRDVED